MSPVFIGKYAFTKKILANIRGFVGKCYYSISQAFKKGINKIDSFHSYSQVSISNSSKLVLKNSSLKCSLKISYPSEISKWTFREETKLIMIIYPTDKSKPILVNTPYIIDGSKDEIFVDLKLPVLTDAKYLIRWGISNSFAEPTINSRAYKLINLNVSR
jgi:hypothetical protein